VAAVALKDRDRVAIALEQADGTDLEGKSLDFTFEGVSMDPLALYAHPKPRVRRGERVFAGNPKYPATTQAPLRPGIDGRVARFQLLHIEAQHTPPLTIWIEPLGAEALLHWAARAREGTANPTAPRETASAGTSSRACFSPRA
jgi:hypothetical protein